MFRNFVISILKWKDIWLVGWVKNLGFVIQEQKELFR